MMSTIREVQAIKILFLACRDATVRARALELVPDLSMFVDEVDVGGGTRRYVLRAFETVANRGPRPGDSPISRRFLGELEVNALPANLERAKATYRRTFERPNAEIVIEHETL